MGGAAELAFGQVLRDRRRELGWSQEQLAEASQTTRGYISLLERGVNSVSIDMLFRLAQALRTSPSTILLQVEGHLDGTAPTIPD